MISIQQGMLEHGATNTETSLGDQQKGGIVPGGMLGYLLQPVLGTVAPGRPCTLGTSRHS